MEEETDQQPHEDPSGEGTRPTGGSGRASASPLQRQAGILLGGTGNGGDNFAAAMNAHLQQGELPSMSQRQSMGEDYAGQARYVAGQQQRQQQQQQ